MIRFSFSNSYLLASFGSTPDWIIKVGTVYSVGLIRIRTFHHFGSLARIEIPMVCVCVCAQNICMTKNEIQPEWQFSFHFTFLYSYLWPVFLITIRLSFCFLFSTFIFLYLSLVALFHFGLCVSFRSLHLFFLSCQAFEPVNVRARKRLLFGCLFFT